VRLAGLLAPHADEEIPTDPFPPGVDEPHRADDLKPFNPRPDDSEEPERVSDHDDTDVALEVNFKDGSLSALKSARKWAEEWLGKPNPAVGGFGPDDVLASGDEAHRDYLFELIAGIECGVHARRQALCPAFVSERCRLGIGATHWTSPTHSHGQAVTTSPQSIRQRVSGAGSCIAPTNPTATSSCILRRDLSAGSLPAMHSWIVGAIAAPLPWFPAGARLGCFQAPLLAPTPSPCVFCVRSAPRDQVVVAPLDPLRRRQRQLAAAQPFHRHADALVTRNDTLRPPRARRHAVTRWRQAARGQTGAPGPLAPVPWAA